MNLTNKPHGLKKIGELALRVVISLLIIGSGIAVFLLLGKAELSPNTTKEKTTPTVEIALAESHTEGIPFQVDGIVVPFRQVQLAAEVSGRISFKDDKFRVGRTVHKQDLLLKIDSSDFKLEFQRLQHELMQAKAMLLELDVQASTFKNQINLANEDLTIRQRELKRYASIDDPGVFSQAEHDTARRNELAARNMLQSQHDQLRQLESTRLRLESARDLVKANLKKTELNLARCEIRAPIDGVVVREEVEQDAYIQQGSPVVLLQDTSKINVACKLYMSQMHWLWQTNEMKLGDNSKHLAYDFPETPVEVVYHLGSISFAWDGVLQRYDGAGVDDQTRMIPCLVHVDKPLNVRQLGISQPAGGMPPTLMTGMFVEVRIRAKPAIPLLRVPQSAVQPGNTIWVVRDKQLQATSVRIAGHDEDVVLIYATNESPQPGEQVVISPLAVPTPGQQVEVEVTR